MTAEASSAENTQIPGEALTTDVRPGEMARAPTLEALKTSAPISRSQTQSPSGSPPLPSSIPPPPPPPGQQVEYFTTADGKQQAGIKSSRSVRYDETSSTPPPRDQSSTRRPRGSNRQVSMSGSGVQVTLNETGSWSDMANQSQTMVQQDDSNRKSSGMLGFLGRKKGRDKSPKARERGVIGKEGARVVVGG